MKKRLGDYIQEYSVRNKSGEDIPVYSITNSQGFCRDYFSKEVASKDKTTYKIVPRGCFAYNPSRINVGSVDWQRDEERVIVSPLYNVFSVSPEIDQQYLYYYLKSSATLYRIKEVATGSVRDNLRLSMLYDFMIELPSLDVQRQIVSNLDLLASIIRQRNQQLTKLDELIKARFVEMFGDPISNPFGFKVKTLQKMIDDGTIMYHLDGNHGSDYPRNEEFVECGVPYISANCIVHNDVNLKLAKHLTEERASKLRKGIAQNGDVLFAHNATVGPVAILYTDDEKVILGTSLTAYRCDKERMVPDYLKAYMQSEGFVCQYTKDMKQTTRNQVPITAQRKFLFVIPPLSLQNQFAAFAAEVDKSKLFAELFAQNACILAENRSK